MLDTRTRPTFHDSPSLDSAAMTRSPHSFRLADAPWFSSFQYAAFGGAAADALLSGGGPIAFMGWWLMVAISMAVASVAVRATLAATQGKTDPRRGLALAGLAAGAGAMLPLTPWGLINGLGALFGASLFSLGVQMAQFATVGILLVPLVSVRASRGEPSHWEAIAIGAAVFGTLTLLF